MSGYDSDIVDSICFGNESMKKMAPQEFGNDSTELGDSDAEPVDVFTGQQNERNRDIIEKRRLIQAQNHLRRAHSPNLLEIPDDPERESRDLGLNFYKSLQYFHEKRVKLRTYKEDDLLSTWKILKKSTRNMDKNNSAMILKQSSYNNSQKKANQDDKNYISNVFNKTQASDIHLQRTVESINMNTQTLDQENFFASNKSDQIHINDEWWTKYNLTNKISLQDVKYTVNLYHNYYMEKVKQDRENLLLKLSENQTHQKSVVYKKHSNSVKN